MFALALSLLVSLVSLVAAAPGASPRPAIVVLGVAQDGGLPHAGCVRECCRLAAADPARRRHVTSLAILGVGGGRWLVEATPDFDAQLRRLESVAPRREAPAPILDGIFVTHAHVGHYLGLAQLGREVMGTREVPVWAMPRLRDFLGTAGPWSQLVALRNIVLRPLAENVAVTLEPGLSVTPFRVPHRDELSETVGFVVAGPSRRVAFVPDIDKWEKWERPGGLERLLAEVDVAYLDATFFADGEVPDRSMAEIPHPFVVETMTRLATASAATRAKVRFIHLNHTNPALDPASAAAKEVAARGFRVAVEGERLDLGGTSNPR